MPTRFGETQRGFLAPTPQRQAAFVSAPVGGATVAGLLRNPRTLIRTWRFGASTMATLSELGGALPALGSSQKFGVRYGGAGVTTIGETFLGAMYLGGTPEANLPVPTFGFGVTAVPNTSSRLVYELNKSRPGEHTSRSGTPQTRKPIRGASAQGKSTRRSRRFAKRKPSRRLRVIPRRGKKCPPGYRYDAKRKMCIQTFKR